MSQSDRGGFRDDVRAASEVLGVVLLVGMVFLGAWLVVVYGSSIIDQVRDQNDEETAKLVVQELDSRLGTLAQLNDVGRARFDIGSTDPDDMVVRKKAGHIRVTVNGLSSCQATIDLSSIRYEKQDGTAIAYEAGGVWQTASRDQGGSTMLTAPDVSFRDGTLDITVVNVSAGTIDESINEARLNTDTSEEQTQNINEAITSGDCIRPDELTLEIKSDFYRAWAEYLRTEIDDDYTVTTNPGSRTVSVTLPQEALPEKADDQRNNVVNLSDPSYMTDGDGNGTALLPSSPDPRDIRAITVDKGDEADNTYRVLMRPLSDNDLELGQFKDEVLVRNSRTPTDVVFILDESGSMGNDGNGDGNTRADDAQRGARIFHASLNRSLDRTGVVTYDQSQVYHVTSCGYHASPHFGIGSSNATCQKMGVNETLRDLYNPNGGTRLYQGIRAAHRVLDLASNQTRNRVAVLLTDGRNDGCYDGDQTDNVYNGPSRPDDCEDYRELTNESAVAAAKSDITIYTIGYGGSANVGEGTLKNVSKLTGGEYYQSATDDELREDFKDIGAQVASEEAIVRQPVTTSTTGGGTTYPPFIAGDTESLATMGASDEFVNINDPTAPSAFRTKFAVEDENQVRFGAEWYDCDKYVTTPLQNEYDGESYQVARCAEIDDSTPPQTLSNEDIRIYLDGDDLTSRYPYIGSQPRIDSGDLELTDTSADWQTSMRDALLEEGLLSSPSDTTVELDSNQALVVYDYPNTPNAANRLPVLYEIGLSEDEALAGDIVNLRVRNVNMTAN